MFPDVRMRRNRKHPWLRSILAENSLTANDLILPIFVIEGDNKKEEISTMPGVYRLSIDLVIEQAKSAKEYGIRAIALFPVIDPSLKNENADEAYNLDNLICTTIRRLRNHKIDIGIICDVALDPYSSHGHDGIIADGEVDNDKTLEALANQALTLAKAGADIIAPSDMMDGRVGYLRNFLDQEGFQDIGILAYAAKYASSFYGPFRDAVGSASTLIGNKKSYQMDPRNIDEAIREVELDINEGADIVMIKPGMPYLDVICEVNRNFHIPIFTYQVSGEYAMLKFAAENNALNWHEALIESLVSFKRAGAQGIFTYGAIDAAKFLASNKINY